MNGWERRMNGYSSRALWLIVARKRRERGDETGAAIAMRNARASSAAYNLRTPIREKS